MRTEEIVLPDGYKSVLTYDDAGLQVRTTDYDAEGNICLDIHYDFDQRQRVVGWKVFDSAQNTLKRFEVDYSPEGLETETRQYGDNGKLERRERYLYDSNNVLAEEQHFDAIGVLRSRKVYERNGADKSAKYYDIDGNVLDGPAV